MDEGTAYGPRNGAGSAMTELARLADELVEEIGAARRHYDDLRAALDTGAAGGGQDESAAADPGTLDEAHLVALSMALTGGTRESARKHLCDAFGIEVEDADDILDQAFGVQFESAAAEPKPKRRFARRRQRV